MWLVYLIGIFLYLVVGIISHICNIVRYFEDKAEKDKDKYKPNQYKPNQYKLEE